MAESHGFGDVLTCPSGTKLPQTRSADLRHALRDNPIVNDSGMLPCNSGFVEFALSDPRRFRCPADIDSLAAPFRTFPGSSQRRALHQRIDGVCMRGRKNPQRDPTAPVDGCLELQIQDFSVRFQLHYPSHHSVYDQLDRHLSSTGLTRSFQVPIWAIERGCYANGFGFRSNLGLQTRTHLRRYTNLAGPLQIALAFNSEVHDMASAIAKIATPHFHSEYPRVVTTIAYWGRIEFHV